MSTVTRLSSALLIFLSAHPGAGPAVAQQIRAVEHPPDGPRMMLSKKHTPQIPNLPGAPSKLRAATVFPGQNVIPQVVDGDGWQTTFTFANLDSTTVRFGVYFFASNGSELRLTIPGVGLTSGIVIALPANETITFETPGTKSDLSQGYAYIDREAATNVVGGLAVFRQRVAGRSDFEAVVPFVSEFDTRFVLLYDNTLGYVTSMAIANPSLDTIQVDATVRDEDANVLASGRITLGQLMHEAFTIPGRWPATAGRRGIIEFRSTGWGASVLGLRFNPGGAFTSFHVLDNLDWRQ